MFCSAARLGRVARRVGCPILFGRVLAIPHRARKRPKPRGLWPYPFGRLFAAPFGVYRLSKRLSNSASPRPRASAMLVPTWGLNCRCSWARRRWRLGVLEKRLWGRFGVAPRNRLKTKDSFGCDCGAVRTPRPTRSTSAAETAPPQRLAPPAAAFGYVALRARSLGGHGGGGPGMGG